MTRLNLTVLDYTDYRVFLADYLALKRAQGRRFSVRQFCLKAGLSTQNYLLKVLRKERNLGPKVAEKFAMALSLKGSEAQYFRTLVYVESARTTEERERYLEDLERLRRRSRGRISPVNDNSFMRHWYIGAIWELASCRQFTLTAKAAAEALRPRVSVQEAKEAIEYLKSRGYLVADAEGCLRPGGTPVFSTDGKADPVIRMNHRQTLQAAIEAIDQPVEKRSFQGMTIAVNHRRLEQIKLRLRGFMEELLSELALDPEADTVYRVQAQVFAMGETQE